jgi:uncharacterized membrane protein YdjX (TVP38/TMEM64 family)
MRKYWKSILLATFLFVIITLNYTGNFSVLNIKLINEHHDYILSYIEAYFYRASLIFILIYIVAVTLSLPGAWLITVTGGYIFGWKIGGLLAIIAATIGACIIFILAKSLLRDFFSKKVIDKTNIFKKIENGVNNNALFYLLFMRLMPIFPFVFVNIVPAILGIRFNIYAFTTFIGIMPGTLVYSLIGEGAKVSFISGNLMNLEGFYTIEIVAGLSGLAFLSLVPIILKYLKFSKNK